MAHHPLATTLLTVLVVLFLAAAVLVLGACVSDASDTEPPSEERARVPGLHDTLPGLPDASTRRPRYPDLADPVPPARDESPGASDADRSVDDSPGLLAMPRRGEIDPPTDPQIEALLDSLSLRRRIGQRFIAHVPGNHVTQGAGSDIVDVAPAGFILYPWNVASAEGARRLVDGLQFVASVVTPGISLLIAADQEGGRVSTFRFPEFVQIPSAGIIGRFADPALVRSAAYLTSRQLREIGVNMNLAPVLDLFGRADATIIGDRSYGADAATVAGFVRPFLDASREAGVIATAKHFPGHGVTTVDSHLELPIVGVSRAELDTSHLVPFVEAIRAGVPAIMTGHLLFEQIDGYFPVTLSRIFLHGILRGELGYEGVVVTDGLEMAAIREHFSLEETLVRLFRYDVDLILLYDSYDVVDLVDTVELLLAQGRISEDDINRGVRRVLRMKREYGLIDGEAL